MIPRFSESIFVYDAVKRDITEIEMPSVKGEKESMVSLLYGFFISGEKIFFLPWRRSKIFYLELGGLLHEFDVKVDFGELSETITGKVLFEDNRGDLEELYKEIGERNSSSFNKNMGIGGNIFKKLK